jgi:ribonuclease E
VTRRMLIAARRPEELRVAIVAGEELVNYQVEVAERGLSRGNIYRGIIANVQPSLNAAFIEYGAERHGFLAIQDVVPAAYYHEPDKSSRPRIEEVLERGMPVVVQVTREAEGGKGSALTTNLSLAGRYLVFTPFDDTRGVSRKVEDEETRASLKQAVRGLEVPPGSGLIVRTNALGENKATLARDLASLLRLWRRIELEARRGEGIAHLYSDQDLLLRALRDHLDPSVEEILVDDEATWKLAEEYLHALLPRTKIKLLHFQEHQPLFDRYDVERQIEAIYERTVPLPSGGSLVIDRTEALIAIDVNSGRSTAARTQEETALNTNLEAANEVARQLRLRDTGGLVVVDFIDMRSIKAKKKVEKELREAMKIDRARSSVGHLSENGLLEINRQRIQQSLQMRTHEPCEACGGTGRVPSAEAAAVSILHKTEARAAIGDLEGARITVHPTVATALRAHKAELDALESIWSAKIEIVSSSRFHRGQHQFEWQRNPAKQTQPTAPPYRKPTPKPAAKPAPKSSAPPSAARVARPRRERPPAPSAKPPVSAPESGAPGSGKRGRRRRGRRGKTRGNGAAGASEVAQLSDQGGPPAAEPQAPPAASSPGE